jgi:hypothetical protein
MQYSANYALPPISLAPLTVEQALKAAIDTGPITDPKLKKPKKPKKQD